MAEVSLAQAEPRASPAEVRALVIRGQGAHLPWTHTLTLALFRGQLMPTRSALHGHTCTPLPDGTALGGSHPLYREATRPTTSISATLRWAGGEGASSINSFRGHPITLLPGERLHLRVREQLPPNFSSGKLSAALPASSKPLSCEPALQGRGTVTKASLFLLPACWHHPGLV